MKNIFLTFLIIFVFGGCVTPESKESTDAVAVLWFTIILPFVAPAILSAIFVFKYHYGKNLKLKKDYLKLLKYFILYFLIVHSVITLFFYIMFGIDAVNSIYGILGLGL